LGVISTAGHRLARTGALDRAASDLAALADATALMLRGLLQVFLQDDFAATRWVRTRAEAVRDSNDAVRRELAAIPRMRLSPDKERRWDESMVFSRALEQVTGTAERVLRDLDARTPASVGEFSSTAVAQVCSLHTLLMHNIRLAANLLLEREADLAQALYAGGRAFQDLRQSYESDQLHWIASGDAGSAAFSAAYPDLFAHIERMNTQVCSLSACFMPHGRNNDDHPRLSLVVEGSVAPSHGTASGRAIAAR